ncbi:hypothetical protein [Streptomyces sp. NPDC092307]|uniref:hypothetical protein n=1 Tax=Streptomyces sp. NPDC092307 TaxID=3366013 RepID=UPI0037FA378F
MAVGAAGAATVTTAGAATAARWTRLGARARASWAVRMRTATLYRVLAVLMVCMAVALVATHTAYLEGLGLEGPVRVADGQADQAKEDAKDTLRRH